MSETFRGAFIDGRPIISSARAGADFVQPSLIKGELAAARQRVRAALNEPKPLNDKEIGT